MQSAISITKTPTVITKVIVLALFTLTTLLLINLISTSKADAQASYMLTGAPACATDCPYGPEGWFNKGEKVWMVCYKDMRWRYTNGRWSNRWFGVLSNVYPNQLKFTPAPAVGNQIAVARCR